MCWLADPGSAGCGLVYVWVQVCFMSFWDLQLQEAIFTATLKRIYLQYRRLLSFWDLQLQEALFTATLKRIYLQYRRLGINP